MLNRVYIVQKIRSLLWLLAFKKNNYARLFVTLKRISAPIYKKAKKIMKIFFVFFSVQSKRCICHESAKIKKKIFFFS